MISAMSSSRPSLADVLPSCLASVIAHGNRLHLPPVNRAVVLLVDGLGMSSLRERVGHARTLASALTKASVAVAGCPTTTAANLATFTTGVSPGLHGLVGYSVLDPANNRIVNQLSGWDRDLDPATWQRMPTVFEQAATHGVPSVVVAQERYRDSGFTHAVLRGARYVSGKSIADRFAAARTVMDSIDTGIIYIYVPELDQTAHAAGWRSRAWTEWLETLDAELGKFIASLEPTEGLLVTADHGVLDVPARSHVLFGDEPSLIDGIRFVAGEPRCLQLHFEPDASPEVRETVLERWRKAEGERAQVMTRHEAVQSGWFGPDIHPEVEPRIGDILVAARKAVAYYDLRSVSQAGRLMVAQHGSFSSDETIVPLLRFGAFTHR